MSDIVSCLKDFNKWATLSEDIINSSSEELKICVGNDFEWLGISTYETSVPIVQFQHKLSSLIFNLLPGGKQKLGLSEDEYEIIKNLPNADLELLNALKPTQLVDIEPFLISQFPLLEKTVSNIIDIDWSIYRPDFQPLSGEETDNVPIYLTYSEVNKVLSHYNFSLPTEAQWEYAIRGGNNTPFYFGNELLSNIELSKIFDTDYQKTEAKSANLFGIVGMLVGGWCQDTLKKEKWHGIDTGTPHIIRGGASIYWPWQNTGEWLLALSAMRRSSEELEDGTCSAHAVIPLAL